MPLSLGQKLTNSIKKEIPETPPRSNPFIYLNDKVSSAISFRVEQLDAPRKLVRLALVSLPRIEMDVIPCWAVEEKHLAFVDREACERRLVKYSRDFARKLYDWYRNALEYAVHELQADIICVNELGFPSFNQMPRKSALNFTRRLCTQEKVLIVAGSTHDRRTLYNTGHVFFPNCPNEGKVYHKQISAVSVNEKISIPPLRKTLSTRVFGLQIATLICLDLADFSSVAAVVKLADRVDVLLVPCYTKWMDSLEKIAQKTSQAMSGIVALPNYRRSLQKTPCILTRFGETMDLGSGHEVERYSSGGLVSIYDLDVEEYREEKNQRLTDIKEDRFEWLFGPQNLPLRKR